MISARERLERAARTNLARDAVERQSGFTAPTDCGDTTLMRTAICALQAGLEEQDWDCVAEAADMLAKRTNYFPWRPAAVLRRRAS
jgi:hypothetical protein